MVVVYNVGEELLEKISGNNSAVTEHFPFSKSQ